jgi:hypothetical protein
MKLIKLGKTIISCIELIEQRPHITGADVAEVVGVESENIRGYLSRVTRKGLIAKHRPYGSMCPTFTVVEGWRDMIEDRADIGNPKPRVIYPDKPRRIKPLPMGAGARALPTRIINSVWQLGNM